MSSVVPVGREAPDVPEVEDVVFELDLETVLSPEREPLVIKDDPELEDPVLALPLALKANVLSDLEVMVAKVVDPENPVPPISVPLTL